MRFPRQQDDKFRVQRGFDAGNHPRRHLPETARFANLFHHLAQQPLRVVAFAEEAPIEGLEPALVLHIGCHRQSSQDNIDPAPRPQNLQQGLLAMRQQICQQQDAQSRNHREQNAVAPAHTASPA